MPSGGSAAVQRQRPPAALMRMQIKTASGPRGVTQPTGNRELTISYNYPPTKQNVAVGHQIYAEELTFRQSRAAGPAESRRNTPGKRSSVVLQAE